MPYLGRGCVVIAKSCSRPEKGRVGARKALLERQRLPIPASPEDRAPGSPQGTQGGDSNFPPVSATTAGVAPLSSAYDEEHADAGAIVNAVIG